MVRIPAEYVDGSSTSCIVTRFTSDSEIIEAFEAEQDAPIGSPTMVSSSHEDEPDADMSLLDSEGAGSSVIAGEQVGISVKIEKDDSVNDEDEHLSDYLVGTSKKPKREDKAIKVGKAQKKKKFSIDD
ncbi:hypothetical protein K1719_039664 [Acacia pycnantha]|nr:hypothetical protein K1719_039664 [Acacia pycnantha]